MALALKSFHESRGARFEDRSSGERLLDFGDPVKEYEALDRACALFDLSDRGRVEVSGEDRAAFVNGQVSNDVAALKVGEGCRAALLNRQSKVLADLRIFAAHEALILDMEPEKPAQVIERLARFRLSSKVEFRNLAGERGLFSLQGPEAPDVAARVFGFSLPEQPLSHAELNWPGWSLTLLSVSRTGRPGLDVDFPLAAGEALWAALLQAGATATGWTTLETGRIEAGLPRFGADITEEHLFSEANLPDAVSHTKGCYVGQEIVARLRSRGHVNRIRAGLLIEGLTVAGQEVAIADRVVGRLTSSAFSPRLGKSVGFAYVKPALASKPEPACEILTPEGTLQARFSPYPFLAMPSATSKSGCAAETKQRP